jgi:hypothetical protein
MLRAIDREKFMKEYPVKGGEFFGESFGDLIIT